MSGSRVLVVDSDREHAEACRTFLAEGGFDVLVAGDAPSALRALDTSSVDFVLLDRPCVGDEKALRARLAGRAKVFGMTDVFVGAWNRDLAMRFDGDVDLWSKPVDPRLALDRLRALGGRATYVESGTGQTTAVPAGIAPVITTPAIAATPPTLESPEPGWGNQPTQVTPHPGAPVVFERPTQDSEEEGDAEDLGATPLPSVGQTRVASAQEVAVAAEMSRSESGSFDEVRADFVAAARSLDTGSQRASVLTGDAPAAEPAQLTARRTARLASGPVAKSVDVVVPRALDVTVLERSGSLADTTFAAVLCRFWASGSTGVIRVNSGGAAKEVYLDAGHVVGVGSDLADDQLSAILVADGLAREDQVDAIARNLGAAAVESEATYVDAGVFGTDELPAVRGFVARRRLLPLFGWTGGSWSFAAEPPPSSARVDVGKATLELIWEGVSHGESPERVRHLLDGHMAQALAWIGQPPSRSDIELTRWQRAIIGSIDGQTPGSEVIMGAPDRDSALALIATLVVAGYVGFAP